MSDKMLEMTIDELCYESNKTARDKGFWDDPNPNFGEKVALIHSELSEALEEVRSGGLEAGNMIFFKPDNPDKPEGVAVELADALIRLGDLCWQYDIPLLKATRLKMAFNKTRPRKHWREF